MKVLILIGNKSIGGAQRVAMHLCKWLNDKQDDNAKIVSLKKTNLKEYDMTGYEVIELSSKNIIFQLVSLIKKEKPDIVLSMGVPMVVYSVPATLITRTKHVISERNDPRNFAGKRLIKVLSRLFMTFGDGFVFQTRDAKNFYSFANQLNSIVIHNPVANLDTMPKNPFMGRRKKTIATVGRLNKQKNHELLIKSFSEIHKKFPDWILEIWGEGSEKDYLTQMISDLELQNVAFLRGATDNVFEKIYDIGCFVLSSDFEGMPNALMEALALGVPCISTDCPCGGPAEIIHDGENGFLVKVNNIEEMCEAIEKVVLDDELKTRVGNKAYDIRKTHDMENICKQWHEFFTYILSGGK